MFTDIVQLLKNMCLRSQSASMAKKKSDNLVYMEAIVRLRIDNPLQLRKLLPNY